MKVSEVVIGTHVQYEGNHYSVVKIEDDEHVQLAPEYGFNWLAPLCKVSGIPLSNEILTNSFGAMQSNMYAYTDDNIMLYIYERCPNSWVVSCDRAEDSEYHEQVIIQYVHELEQFLSHVGFYV